MKKNRILFILLMFLLGCSNIDKDNVYIYYGEDQFILETEELIERNLDPNSSIIYYCSLLEKETTKENKLVLYVDTLNCIHTRSKYNGQNSNDLFWEFLSDENQDISKCLNDKVIIIKPYSSKSSDFINKLQIEVRNMQIAILDSASFEKYNCSYKDLDLQLKHEIEGCYAITFFVYPYLRVEEHSELSKGIVDMEGTNGKMIELNIHVRIFNNEIEIDEKTVELEDLYGKLCSTLKKMDASYNTIRFIVESNRKTTYETYIQVINVLEKMEEKFNCKVEIVEKEPELR